MEDLKQLVKTQKTASEQFKFRTPAEIQDFKNDPEKQKKLNKLWNENLNGFTQQGIQSNPWNTTNTPEATNYFNPIENTEETVNQNLEPWSAFPGRLGFNFNVSENELNKIADTGEMPGEISSNPCTNSKEQVAYFPYGPRGWQDEYCEWTVTRNSDNKIVRVDFTCENPEYWNSLWRIDPNKVLELYQQVLDKPQIKMEDLILPGIKDPVTGTPAYNPLNKWNSGTISNESTGGAIHLTSTPNTLQTEIGLAATSTVLRYNAAKKNTVWNNNNDLLCFAQLGQAHRNSDPSIAGQVNKFVNDGFSVSIANPPGLYIQSPNFENFKTPNGENASKYWKIIRGQKELNINGKKLPGEFILHAKFEVPEDENFVVQDITINNENIKWGAQIAREIHIQIVASAFKNNQTSPSYGKVGDKNNPLAQPLQLFHKNYFTAMYNKMIPNPVNNPISLLSNSTMIPEKIKKGSNNIEMVLTVDSCNANPNKLETFPRVFFSDKNINAKVLQVIDNIVYAVPGNSSPSKYTALYISIDVSPLTQEGVKNVYVTNYNQEEAPSMPALINVVN